LGVLEDFAGRNTIVRPTYIVGPGDHTDRFTYWPWRMSQGGDMLAPGTPDDPIQYLDVRDLVCRFKGGGLGVDGVSFAATRGEMICVMGASGCGKWLACYGYPFFAVQNWTVIGCGACS
jgi:hypothetical protein